MKNIFLILIAFILLNGEFTIQKADCQNNNRKIRVIYLVPSDKKENSLYKESIEKAIISVKNWYQQKANDSFILNSPVVEVIKSNHVSSWYNNTKSKFWGENKLFWFNSNAIEDVMNLAGAGFNDPEFIWVIYVDAVGNTGAGGSSFASLPEHDVLGVSGLHPSEKNIQRWYGGLAHEIGHVFGLSHPGESESNALMQYGYAKYPDCYLTDSDLKILKQNPFFSKNSNIENFVMEKYSYKGGAFVKKKNGWAETNDNGSNYFEETGRDESFIYIEDKRRNLKIKIPVKNGWCLISFGNDWRQLYYTTKEK